MAKLDLPRSLRSRFEKLVAWLLFAISALFVAAQTVTA